ncbi:MAG: cyclic nucleotide-binding domain-containing protein [Methylococcaceae bacterium]|nr:cyclic nucleotide-binding domain-containing protein [Methylococcaceae bacterium]
MKDLIQAILNDPAFPAGIAWRRRLFYANETVISVGDTSNSFFLIEEGQLRVTVLVELGKHKKVHPGICDLGAGDIFGETCLLESGVRSASIIAITNGCAVEIYAEKFNYYLETKPVQGHLFFKHLFAIMTDRLQRCNRRIENLMVWGLKAYEIEKHL